MQFLGSRTFTFRAQNGVLSRQAVVFAGVELVALSLNLGLYELLVSRVHVLPPEILSFLGTFVVFICFAYPMHKVMTFRPNA